MPGIFGYVKQTQANNNNSHASSLDEMQQAMELNFIFNKEIPFSDNLIAQSAIHLHFRNLNITENNYDLKLEGESYNWKKVSSDYKIKASNFSELLLEAYKINKLNIILKNIDGYFCGSLYDKIEKKVLLFCDRWGMRFLYYYYDGKNFAWASEIKGLLALPFVKKDIDETSVSCFINIGYLLADHTPFKYIKLLKQASILEFNLISRTRKQSYYWKWSELKKSSIPYTQSVKYLAELMLLAVKKRINTDKRVVIALSGGLDSRMLFAAANKIMPNHHGFAFTFGKQDCLDVNIAKQVIAKSNFEHKVFEITPDNWFEPRLEKVWLTDGMQNIKHMHGSEFANIVSKEGENLLNGYAGDAICGPSFLKANYLNKRITANIAADFYKEYTELAEINDDFYDYDDVFPNLFANRVRRFTTMGSINWLFYMDQQKPFLDNELMEFIFSLPNEYRIGNKIYSDALLKVFPEYFEDIPWQKTGFPIGKRIPLGHKVFHFIKRVLRKLKICDMLNNNEYTNYPEWLRQVNLVNQLTKLLAYKGSVYSQYTTEDFYNKYLIPHLARKVDNSEYILRAATIAVYLKTVSKT